jgi:hypothetical protein
MHQYEFFCTLFILFLKGFPEYPVAAFSNIHFGNFLANKRSEVAK